MKFKIITIFLFLLLSNLSYADSYKLAIYPSNHPQKLIIPMKIMAEYLSQKSGDKFIAVVTRDYAELSERLRNKTIQSAGCGPGYYPAKRGRTGKTTP